MICPKCRGVGRIPFGEEPEIYTEQEWLQTASTEQLAEWLADHMKCSKCPQQNRCNGYHGGCVALMVEWLKQPHREDMMAKNE